MKKLIFGLGLLLSGIIGFVGWSIAAALTVQPGSRSEVFGCFDKFEGMVLVVFIAMAIAGFVIAAKEIDNGP